VLAKLATAHGWRLVHLTYGGCPSILTPIWSVTLKRVHTECDSWRDDALARLEAERPNLTIISNSEHPILVDDRGHSVAYSDPPTPSWTQLWAAGLERLLSRLSSIGGAVAVIGDGPVPIRSGFDPIACIAEQKSDFTSCHATRSTALPPAVHEIDRLVAASHGATFVDPTPWLCSQQTCPAVIDRFIVYMDSPGHLTTPFTLSLADRLMSAVPFPSPPIVKPSFEATPAWTGRRRSQ
jgi:hypothetical protein